MASTDDLQARLERARARMSNPPKTTQNQVASESFRSIKEDAALPPSPISISRHSMDTYSTKNKSTLSTTTKNQLNHRLNDTHDPNLYMNDTTGDKLESERLSTDHPIFSEEVYERKTSSVKAPNSSNPSTANEWLHTPQESYAFSESLCQEIQSAVDAVAGRLEDEEGSGDMEEEHMEADTIYNKIHTNDETQYSPMRRFKDEIESNIEDQVDDDAIALNEATDNFRPTTNGEAKEPRATDSSSQRRKTTTTPNRSSPRSEVSAYYPPDLKRSNDRSSSTSRLSGLSPAESSSTPTMEVGSTNKNALLLIIEVIIGDGRTAKIHVHEHDEPDELAHRFVLAHELNMETLPTLVQLIQNQLDAVLSPRSRASSTSSPSTLLPETEREQKYQALVNKYGPYKTKTTTTRSGTKSTSMAASSSSSSWSTTTSSASLSQHGASKKIGRDYITSSMTKKSESLRNKSAKAYDAKNVYQRLFHGAEAKERWLQRAQKTKVEEEERRGEEAQAGHKHARVDAHPRGINAVYERPLKLDATKKDKCEALYEYGSKELLRRREEEARRPSDVEQNQDWICPKCAHVNKVDDALCQYVKGTKHRDGFLNPNSSVAKKVQEAKGELCGQPKPRLFQPTLISKADELNRKTRAPTQFVHEALYDDNHLSHAKKMARAKEIFEETYTFKPQLNEYSIELVKQKGNKQSQDHLYVDAIERQIKLKQTADNYYNSFTFKPDIGSYTANASNAASSSADASEKLNEKDMQNSVDRLSTRTYHIYEEKRAKLMEQYGSNLDPETGRALFQPSVGRGPLFNRNDGNLPIGDFLYASRNEFKNIHDELQKQELKKSKMDRERSFVSEESKKMIRRRKLRRFNDLFTQLKKIENTTGDIVTPTEASLDKFDKETASILRSSFELLQWKPMTLAEFRGAVDRSLESRQDVTPSKILIEKKAPPQPTPTKEEREGNELTFHPVVNVTSELIMKEQGRGSTGDVYSSLYQQHYKYSDNLKRLKQRQEDQLKTECTFKPTLLSKKNNKKSQSFYERISSDTKLSTSDEMRKDQPLLKTVKRGAAPTIRSLFNDDKIRSSTAGNIMTSEKHDQVIHTEERIDHSRPEEAPSVAPTIPHDSPVVSIIPKASLPVVTSVEVRHAPAVVLDECRSFSPVVVVGIPEASTDISTTQHASLAVFTHENASPANAATSNPLLPFVDATLKHDVVNATTITEGVSPVISTMSEAAPAFLPTPTPTAKPLLRKQTSLGRDLKGESNIIQQFIINSLNDLEEEENDEQDEQALSILDLVENCNQDMKKLLVNLEH